MSRSQDWIQWLTYRLLVAVCPSAEILDGCGNGFLLHLLGIHFVWSVLLGEVMEGSKVVFREFRVLGDELMRFV